MNKMIEFAKENRTTTYFRDTAIQEIKIAFRIMEYLAPDSVFKAGVNSGTDALDSTTKDMMLHEMFEQAFERIEDEVLIANEIGCGSSMGYECMKEHAIELMKYLLPLYQNEVKDAIELLRELKELDS